MSSIVSSGGEVLAGCAIQETFSSSPGLSLHSWGHKVDGLAVMTSLVLSLGAQSVHQCAVEERRRSGG